MLKTKKIWRQIQLLLNSTFCSYDFSSYDSASLFMMVMITFIVIYLPFLSFLSLSPKLIFKWILRKLQLEISIGLKLGNMSDLLMNGPSHCPTAVISSGK